jgi:hypothetical protein
MAWEEPATEDEQAGYENAIAAVTDALYEDDKTHEAVMRMLSIGDPLQAIAKAAVMLITEIDKKIDIPRAVLFELPGDLFDMLHELGDKAGLFTLTPQQEKTGVAATQELVLKAYGMDEEELQDITSSLTEQDVQELSGVYQEVTSDGVPTESIGGGSDQRLGDNGSPTGGETPETPQGI